EPARSPLFRGACRDTPFRPRRAPKLRQPAYAFRADPQARAATRGTAVRADDEVGRTHAARSVVGATRPPRARGSGCLCTACARTPRSARRHVARGRDSDACAVPDSETARAAQAATPRPQAGTDRGAHGPAPGKAARARARYDPTRDIHRRR